MKIYYEICIREVVGSYGKNSHNLNSYTHFHKCYSRQPNSETPHISFLIILIQNVSVAYIDFLFLSSFFIIFFLLRFHFLRNANVTNKLKIRTTAKYKNLVKFVFEIPTGKQPTFEMFCCIGIQHSTSLVLFPFSNWNICNSCWPSGITNTIVLKYLPFLECKRVK